MIKKILRELYLLPRGEQRALVFLSFLLILGILIRVTVQLLPQREPPGMSKFIEESRAIMASFNQIDSLLPVTKHSPTTPVTHHPVTNHNAQSPNSLLVNINTADSAQLLPLPGIGPVFAGRIIRYRNLLGGYISVDQLHEVYGLKGETIRLIRDNIYVDRSAIHKIQMDSASFRNLLRHPYLQLEDVKALVNYRVFNDGLDSLEEIYENNLISDSTLEKISPYLQFNH